MYGSGHVIAHNAVAFFHDGIACAPTACPEPERSLWAVAIDIYNNDIHVTGDDFIEADGGVHNIRVMRNRGINAAHTGLSAQPIFGGPAYYIRNIVYNTPVALKFINPAGVIVYHNTIIAENRTATRVSNAHFRNNLFLGTDAPVGIAVLGGPTAYSTLRLQRLSAQPRRGAPVLRGSVRSQACWSTTRSPPEAARGSRRSRSSPRRRARRPTGSKWTTTSSRICVRQPRRIRRSPARPTRPWI